MSTVYGLYSTGTGVCGRCGKIRCLLVAYTTRDQCMTFTFKHRAGAAAGRIFWTHLGRGPAAGQKPGRPYPSAVMPYLAAPICAY
jgi:hypothetical protein